MAETPVRNCLAVCFVVLVSVCAVSAWTWQTQSEKSEKSVEKSDITIETFPVIDLPVSISDVTLTKNEKGYLLNGTLSSSSDQKILGVRYLLVLVDANNAIRPAIMRSEGCNLAGNSATKMTFSTPLKLKLRNVARMELMLDQVIGEISIWEVLKARQTLEKYASGDYSPIPKVLRVSNHVDAPLQQNKIR
jgi:hypothetical protein